MSAAAFTINFDNTSDTTYRAWVNAIDAQILALGWVHTSDTGQFNLATGTRSGTPGSNYIVYQTNDGLTPMVVRISYAARSVVTLPGIAVTVGWATDGAGNIAGSLQSNTWTAAATANDTASRNCIISGGPGRLLLALNLNAATVTNSILISVERSKDTSGADTSTAALCAMLVGGVSNGISSAGNARANAALYLPGTGTAVPNEDEYLPAVLSNTRVGSSAFGTTIGVGVPIPLAGSAQNPGTNILVCLSADYPTRDSTTTVALYGTNHTYYAIGPNWNHCVGIAGTAPSNTISLFVRDD